MHSYEYLIFSDKIISTPLTGYIRNLSPIKYKVSTNKKHFDFRLLTEKKSEQTVCFLPEKHKLLKVIEQENEGCKIKRFRRTECNDTLITDSTSIKKKKMKLGFSRNINSGK